MKQVAIIGIGSTKFTPTSPELSYKELTYQAATKAYSDAGISFSDVQSFVSCTEDFTEGTSIADEYCPDQMGAARKPVHTISGDGLLGISSAILQIQAGLFDIVAVEGHSKASNVVDMDNITVYAMDPIYERPLGLRPDTIAALEMNRYLFESKKNEEDVANVVVKNRRNALKNPLAPYGATLSPRDVLNSETTSTPLRKAMIALHSDGALLVVLASEEKARQLCKKPVWIRGISWISGPPELAQREWGNLNLLKQAAKKAYKMADVAPTGVQLVEVDDTFAHRELMHLEAMGLANGASVNLSGGALGMGNLLEASGLAKTQWIVSRLRQETDKLGLVQSWRGLPTQSYVVIIFG